jgi:hypothetical protein
MPYVKEETYTIINNNPTLKDFVRNVTLVIPKAIPMDMPYGAYPIGVVRAIDFMHERVLIGFENRITKDKPYFMSEHPLSFFIIEKNEVNLAPEDNNPNTSFKRKFRREIT